MKESWKYEILGNVCDVLDSKRKPITKNKRVSGAVPYYGATGVLDFVKDFIFDEKLVLLGEDGAKWGAGELSSYIINGKSWVNNHAHTLRPKRYIISDEFLVYYLNYSNLLDYVSGTTVPKLNQANMRRIEIPLPTLSDQQKIVDLLDAEFEKIDAIKSNAASQLQSAKDLFQSALKEVFEANRNCKYEPLGEIVEIKRGLTYSKNDEVDISGKIVLRSNNVNLDNYQFDFTELKYLNPTFDIPADKYLQKGDLLMCMSNGSKAHLGKVALYEGESDKYAFGGFMAALSHKDSVIGRYLFYAMITPMYKEYIKTLSDGANINNLKVRDIEAFSIPVPPLPEQERIAARLDAISEKVKALQANYDNTITLCNDLKQSLLKSIFA